MNSITINDKQYIYTNESEDCSDCDLRNLFNKCQFICNGFGSLLDDKIAGVFKELKIE